jgi:hypothetical protein
VLFLWGTLRHSDSYAGGKTRRVKGCDSRS